MLTKGDLNAIGKIVDVRLDQKFDMKLKPIHDDIKIVKRDVKKLQKDLDVSIDLTDKLQISLENRVKIIEKNLKIPTPDFI